MGNKRQLMERLMESTAIAGQSLPNQPVIEIMGNRRVLIENHCGVKEYGLACIRVLVPFGCVCISGCDLELVRMTKEQLVISGCVQSVHLYGKEHP